MPISEAEHNSLLIRLTRLERHNRIWKMVGLLIALTSLILLAGNARANQDVGVRAPNTTVEAHTYLLKDSAGVLRGKMTVDGDRHPVLEFYDLDGNVIWSTDTRAVPAK
ncbi:MAG: hypothetical protein WAL95_14440 [Candidatus Acidiferrales bacterium]